jgi:hypothetical protein
MTEKTPAQVAAPPQATADPGFAPPAVQETLARPGRPLEQPVRGQMERRLGHDFSRVRVHSDAQAASSARAVDAAAYTVGSDVVLGAGATPAAGSSLLAHELAHTVQQRDAAPAGRLSVGEPHAPAERAADRAATGGGSITPSTEPVATLQRRTVFDSIAGLFAGDDFPKADLDTYLALLDKTNAIEDFNESDNKARAIVKQWHADRSKFALTPKLKTLLIKEMLSGFTGDDDEQAILVLLTTADNADLTTIFSPSGVTPARLDSDINGAENKQLRVFLTSRFTGTIDDIIAGKGTLKVARSLTAPYSKVALPQVLEDRANDITAVIGGIKDDAQRNLLLRQLAQPMGDELADEVAKLKGADHDSAVSDMLAERVARNDLYRQAQRDAQVETARASTDKANEASHKANADRLKSENESRAASLAVLDVALSTINAAVALSTPKAALAAGVAKLTPGQKTEAQEALKPSVAAAKPAFVEKLAGEPDGYKEQVAHRAPNVVLRFWNRLAKDRQPADHVAANLHPLAELAVVSKAAADEVDLVFGAYKKAAALTPDVLDAAGKVTTPGTIHDVFQREQANKAADPKYPEGSANFWMFYLLQNDNSFDDPDSIASINFKHNARPELDDKTHKGKNTEGKELEAAARAELAIGSEVNRLFEIGRAWDAFNNAGDVSVQLFKGKTDDADRRYLWDMFFTLMHEYLHTLAHKNYRDFADKVGGEATTPGNTLIEGVDAYLSEIVWTHALPRTSLPVVRDKVEPAYVAKGLPYDRSLLPAMPHRRYTNYEKAAKLVSVVGIKNVYAAYFLGDLKAIGQTP